MGLFSEIYQTTTTTTKGRSINYVRREVEGGVEKLDQNANAVREVA